MDSWNQHKDLLRILYYSKDRKIGTLRNIMAHMQAEHKFVRSKGQYERQFKKWGLRKNSTSEDWRAIHGKMQKRQKEGKKSAVYKSGRHVQAEKLNKEKRHNFRKAGELFISGQFMQAACCVERYCQHAMEQLPGTPAGFTVCTPMGDTTPPLLINNLPSLRLFGQLRSFVSDLMKTSRPSTSSNIDDLTGNHEAVFVRMGSNPLVDKQVVASVNTKVTASAAIHAEEDRDNDSDLDLQSFTDWKLNGKNLRDLFQPSRTGELSPLVLPMLHRASNNLLSWCEANDIVDLISQSSDRRVFNALISPRSPATQAIARSLLPAAIDHLDLELVRSLLDSGISPDAPINYNRQTVLQLVLAGPNLNHEILDLVQLLLSYGAEVNSLCTKHTSTPLVYAAGRGHLGLVQLFLAAGADVNANASANETTALQAAAGAYVDMRVSQAVAESDRLGISQLLLNAGADVNADRYGPRSGATALREAVASQNLALVQLLLSYGANVNVSVGTGNQTTLQVAAHTGNLEIINLLLIWGASHILPAIECALEQGHSQAAAALLPFGPGLDYADSKAYSRMALGVGIRTGDYCFVQGILKSGVDMEARTGTHSTSRMTALQEAVVKGDIDLVCLLISFGADVNASAAGRYGKTALQSAAHAGNAELTRFLLVSGADVNAPSSGHCDGMMALKAAVSADSLEVVRLLLDSGADVFVQGAGAIMEAVSIGCRPSNSSEIVQLLLSYFPSSGVERFPEDYEIYSSYCIDHELMPILVQYGVFDEDFAFRYATDSVDIFFVELALDLGSDVNAGQQGEDDIWDLETAVSLEYFGMLQVILEHGANLREKTRALQLAAHRGFLETVEALIDAGADVNGAPTFYSYDDWPQARTALQAAAQEGHLDVVRILLEAGAQVERSSISEDEEGTALQFAAIAGSIVIANELIQSGANVNAAPLGEDGRTALEGAAEHGRLDMVQLLLNLEAEVQGSRALQFARKEGHDGVAMLLLQNGFEDDVRMSR